VRCRLARVPWGVGLAAVFGLSGLVMAVQQSGSVPRNYRYEIVKTYPHDSSAYTQGLIYLDGFLYESTGLSGRSSVRKVDIESGRSLQQFAVLPEYFAEGLTGWGSDLIQLTYQTQTGFVYDRATLKLKSSFPYTGEGWGLTHDGKRLIMSDGTSTLRFLDPNSFRETGRIVVRDRGQPVRDLNELEYVRGELLANVWQSDRIARISVADGRVTGWIDLTGLLPKSDRSSGDAVLNGIAWDSVGDRLFVTGKLWPSLFEIQLVPKK